MENVKGRRECLLLVFLCIWAYGCIPTIGAVVQHSVNTKRERRAFVENFHITNILRHEAGLPPLDLCTEKYKFDKYWARQDPECKDKIKEFDKGEKVYTTQEVEQLQEIIEKK